MYVVTGIGLVVTTAGGGAAGAVVVIGGGAVVVVAVARLVVLTGGVVAGVGVGCVVVTVVLVGVLGALAAPPLHPAIANTTPASPTTVRIFMAIPSDQLVMKP